MPGRPGKLSSALCEGCMSGKTKRREWKRLEIKEKNWIVQRFQDRRKITSCRNLQLFFSNNYKQFKKYIIHNNKRVKFFCRIKFACLSPTPLKVGLFVPVERAESGRFQTVVALFASGRKSTLLHPLLAGPPIS